MAPLGRCPQCGGEAEKRENPFRPFCSERCKLIDLGNWLGERYRIPGAAEPATSDEEAEK
jgi:endogenous inhibitor of DNA gyrase (YacG/DUF329 family)